MGEETRRGPVTVRTWVFLAVVVVIASALGIALGLIIDWFPAQGSNWADKIDTFWDVLLIASVPVFVIVTTVVLFSVIRWRVRPGEELLDGPPIHGNTKIEIAWTAIPAVIIGGLCAYATILLLDIQDAPAKSARVVNVTGQQFAWTFGTSERGKQIVTNRLVLPVGEEVSFKIRSKDVIHDFWVPEWRLKEDAVPGITTSYHLTPTKTGTFEVVCAELCGLGHAFMRQTVSVVTPEAYRRYIALLTAVKPAPAGGAAGGGAAVDGKQIFTEGNSQTGATACGSCHTLAAAGTSGATGPNLEATKGWDAAKIREAIVNPNKEIAKGFGANIMPPNYQQTLSAPELNAVVKFIDESVNG